MIGSLLHMDKGTATAESEAIGVTIAGKVGPAQVLIKHKKDDYTETFA